MPEGNRNRRKLKKRMHLSPSAALISVRRSSTVAIDLNVVYRVLLRPVARDRELLDWALPPVRILLSFSLSKSPLKTQVKLASSCLKFLLENVHVASCYRLLKCPLTRVLLCLIDALCHFYRLTMQSVQYIISVWPFSHYILFVALWPETVDRLGAGQFVNHPEAFSRERLTSLRSLFLESLHSVLSHCVYWNS